MNQAFLIYLQTAGFPCGRIQKRNGDGMENSKLNRINELARLAKERELTPEERSERDALRKEYIAEWRRGAEQVLENTYIVTPDGKKRKLQKRS